MALVLAATPLGNPLDASTRLKNAIESAEIIAAEDSRRFHRLASDLGVTFTARIISFFEGNETDRTQEILTLLQEQSTQGAIVIAILHAPDQSIAGAREIEMVER